MPYGFENETLSPALCDDLNVRRRRIAADIVRLTSLAGSGHPGGSLSTLDALLVLYACGTLDGANPRDPSRDRVVVSHGHISPGVYGTLASYGYVDIRDAYIGFRRAGSIFGGHIETLVPGVEWNTGNLGQGLSAGCGFALAAQLKGEVHKCYVFMGDGEQQKGQLSEARRFAVKFGLNNLVALVDVNRLQIGGLTDEIMPMDLDAVWRADGWNVVSIDGHDHQAIYAALRGVNRAPAGQAPTVILLNTVMGKGIPAIENDHNYHGQALKAEMLDEAFAALGQPNNLAALRALRESEPVPHASHEIPTRRDINLATGTPRSYGASVKTDCRSAYGAALHDLAVANRGQSDAWPIVGLSCDLEGSVKMNAFHKETPERFIEVGISEHHAAVLAGALSREGIVPFYSTFGMFAMIEGYNQQRLNDQNATSPNVVMTHCGLDVGEDGPTHQCIDYVSLLRNLFGWEVYVPADPNETDRIIRTVATRYAPTCVAMGRSKLPVLTTRDGEPVYATDDAFVPGRWTTVRDGDDAVVFAFGPMVYRAVEASDLLLKEGIKLRVVNASSLQPFDRACIISCAQTVKRVLTYEDHHAETGLGAIVAGVIARSQLAVDLRTMGVTRYGTSGVPDDLFAEQGLSPSDLANATRTMLAKA